jgi:hypothetical protein
VRGILRRVEASRGRRPGSADREVLSGSGSRKTRRTPGPEAGCNKPAADRTEQTVEVVRDHEGGTGSWVWQPGTEGGGVRVGAGSGRRIGAIRRRGERESQMRRERGATAPRALHCGTSASKATPRSGGRHCGLMMSRRPFDVGGPRRSRSVTTEDPEGAGMANDPRARRAGGRSGSTTRRPCDPEDPANVTDADPARAGNLVHGELNRDTSRASRCHESPRGGDVAGALCV